MTYCLGIVTKAGIVGLADTRITSGTETTTAKKVFTVNRKKHAFFIMASGLRSVRDKAITYFGEMIEQDDHDFTKLYQVVNKLGEQVKRVRKEDKDDLEDSGMAFNLYAIVGGQLENDPEPKLFMLYPQGNWIEIGEGTPYVIIGNTGFGQPILRRSIKPDSDLEFSLKSAFLSFDAARISANDVDYPIDTVVLHKNSYEVLEHRFSEKELGTVSEFWNEKLRAAISELPVEILDRAFEKKSTLLRKTS